MKDRMGVLRKIELYQSLMGGGGLQGAGPEGALEQVMRLSEVSYGLRRPEGIKHALRLAEEMRREGLTSEDDARLHYYESVAWEKLRLLGAKDRDVWQWEQVEIEQELIHLRRAFTREAIAGMPRERAAGILSSMATLCNYVGRFSEAVEYWDGALGVMPSSSMARGKRGYALTHYAHALYDRGQTAMFFRRARTDLGAAIGAGLDGGEAGQYFSRRLRWTESRLVGREQEDGGLELFNYSEGSSEAEVRYRRWSLEHRLFLNPLNDLGPYPAGARDELIVPPVLTAEKRTFHHGFFNQLKQAYVSARYMYYEGLCASTTHFADRDVLLLDTMDCPSYSLSVEKAKAAFSGAYSIFGKIARFLNHYLALAIPENRVTFRSFWYNGQQAELGLREEFRERRNWPMRGLFWLGKDLYEDSVGFTETIDPHARQLSEIRYHLDQSYLKLHEDLPVARPGDGEMPPNGVVDTLAYSVHRKDFEAKTLRLLKLARAALMYLCLAVHMEEKRAGAKDEDGECLPAIILGVWEDSWKV